MDLVFPGLGFRAWGFRILGLRFFWFKGLLCWYTVGFFLGFGFKGLGLRALELYGQRCKAVGA